MNKTLLITGFLLGSAIAGVTFAQDVERVYSPYEQFELELKNVPNPFKTGLPIETEEEEETPDPGIVTSTSSSEEAQSDGDEATTDQGDGSTQTAAGTDDESQDEAIEVVEPPEEIVPLPQIKVTGIIWDSDRPQAIIDGSIVNIGDSIQGIQVTEINKTGISGMFHGRTVFLSSQRSF